MSSLYDWSLTAADNATADSDINFEEFQNPDTVNDSARKLMARVAEWRRDLGGSITTGGTGNAYTVTINSPVGATYPDGLTIWAMVDRANSGSATLSVTSGVTTGPTVPIRAKSGTALPNNSILANNIYAFRYRSASNEFIVSGSNAGFHELAPSLLSASVFGLRVGDPIISFNPTPNPGFVRLTETTQSLLKASYPDLNAWASGIGYPWGSASTTFNLPPAAGYFLRFAATTSAIDPSGARALGSIQSDGIKTHTHGGTTGDESNTHTHAQVGHVEDTQLPFSGGGGNPVIGTPKRVSANTGVNSTGHTHDFTTSSMVDGITETRPKNVAFALDILAVPALVASGLIGTVGYSYRISTSTTAADPGTGYLRLNNAAAASATALYISETDVTSTSLAGALATWDSSTSTTKGRLRLLKVGAPAIFAEFDITGTRTDSGTWNTFTLTYRAGPGGFTDGDQVHVQFVPKGDASGGGGGAWGDITGTLSAQTDLQAALNAKVSIAALAASTGAGLVGHTDGGTGAVTMSLNEYVKRAFDTIPYAYGVTADGTTNDTAALQLAINHAATRGVAPYDGAIVKLPAGVMVVDGSLTIPGDSWVSIVGHGKASVIKWMGGNNAPLISMDDGSDESKITFANFGLVLGNAATGVIGIQTCVTPGNAVVNVTIRDMYFGGLHTALDTWTETDQITFENNYLLGYTYGVRSRGGTCSNFFIRNNHFRAGVAGSWAVDHAGGWNIVIDGNTVQSDVLGAKAFKLTGVNTFQIANTYYEVIGTPNVTDYGTFALIVNSRNGYIGRNVTVGASALFAAGVPYCNAIIDGTSKDVEIGPNNHIASDVSGTIEYFAEAAVTTKRIHATGAQTFIAHAGIESAYVQGQFLGPVTPWSNVVTGRNAGTALTTGTGNVMLGINAGTALTTGSHAVAIGDDALKSQTAFAPSYIDASGVNTNIAIGPHALESTTVSWGNIAIGRNALKSLTANPSTIGTPDNLTANYNQAIGDRAGEAITTGIENMLFGNNTGMNITTGNVNSAFGSESLRALTTGLENSALGVSALQAVTTGGRNIGIGAGAGGNEGGANANTTGSYNTFLGYAAQPASPTQRDHMTVIGADSTGDRDNTLYLGRISDNIIIGGAGITTTAGLSIGPGNVARAHINIVGGNEPTVKVDGDLWFNNGVFGFFRDLRTYILNCCSFFVTPTTLGFTGGGNLWMGRNAGNTTLLPNSANGQAANNSAIGNAAGQALTTGFNNTLVGNSVGNALTSASSNTFLGYLVGNAATTASQNIVIGSNSYSAVATANSNMVIGYNTATAMVAATQNIVLGNGSGNAMVSSFYNTVVGFQSATGVTSSSNTIIGAGTAGGLTSGAGNTIIGASLNGLTSSMANTLILGAGGVQLLVADGTTVRPQKPIKTPTYTVATLPAASASYEGARAYVTDATAPTFLGALTGGGAVICPVFCNGAAWVAG